MTETGAAAEDFWEDFYRERDQHWSGRPNELLVREVSPLPPATALDLGCGEGGDAIWLAHRGWRVTAADISAVALGRAEARAAEEGVAGLIDWQRHDLARSFPAGTFDLVSAAYLHSPVEAEGERAGILRRAAAAVAPGGVLLVVGHAGWPSFVDDPHVHYDFPTTADVIGALDVDPARWRVETEELVTREATAPDGRNGTRADTVVKLRRTA
ncbi:class I SAM-dependent methyltransferase [Microbispora corallina]|uniref:Methyltransferase n=1 Tax=Microbispora corallina TaxID=83302 RepID=A0ABQ4G1G4_9ACTN|nr:class I SAM-dependent methyltransferase [Microbispora corallina]GIH40818.1 methyltransferase [Microbispora corallina]